jgi:hydroxymethylpyrimidine pyrophosphatase-like HAD family hydrolase
MESRKEFVIGIDLHGTLLDDEWRIDPKLNGELTDAIKDVRKFSEVVTCTGNDLTFIQEHIPRMIRTQFEGHVIETGCTFSNGAVEEPLVSDKEMVMIQELTAKLKDDVEKSKIPHVLYFGRRLATISLFTVDKGRGMHPGEILEIVKQRVKDHGFEKDVMVTRSNVAVDVIPRNHDKASGLKAYAKKRSIPKTMGIADSLNDHALMEKADFGFMPANASPELIGELINKGKFVKSLENADPILTPDTIILATQRNTQGVIEILHFIENALKNR